jgi:hypothetical protein
MIMLSLLLAQNKFHFPFSHSPRTNHNELQLRLEAKQIFVRFLFINEKGMFHCILEAVVTAVERERKLWRRKSQKINCKNNEIKHKTL